MEGSLVRMYSDMVRNFGSSRKEKGEEHVHYVLSVKPTKYAAEERGPRERNESSASNENTLLPISPKPRQNSKIVLNSPDTHFPHFVL